MNNTRFATAIHILTLLTAESSKEEWVSSEYIAGSININPVIVRRELTMLQEAGLITSKKGKEGGSKLGKDATHIFLSDIYSAVKNSEILGKKNKHPNCQCPIGRQINEKLDEVFSEAERQVIQALEKISLYAFTKQFF